MENYRPRNLLIILGVILGILAWVFESAIHVIFSCDKDLITEIFSTNPHDILTRFIFVSMIMVFAALSEMLFVKQRKIYSAMKKSEKDYRTLVETLTDVVFALDTRGKITFINPRAETIMGYRAEELVGRNFLDIVSPDMRDISQDRFSRGLKGEHIPVYELDIIGPDNRIISLEVNVSTMHDENGIPTGRMGVARDITQRKSIENALRESEEKFRALAESSPTAIMLYQDNKWIYANAAAEKISGYPGSELYGMYFWDIVHPDYRPLVQKRGAERQQGISTTQRYEFKIVSKSGKDIWVDLSGATIMLEGKPAGIITVIDITERKEYEANLKASETKYRNILEGMQEGYLELDLNGRFTFFNNSLCRILEYPREELEGKDYRDFMTTVNRRKVTLAARDIYTSGKEQDILNFEIVRGDHTQGILEMSLSLIRDPRNEPVGFRGIIRDVTAQKRLELQLLQAQKMEAIGTLAGGIAHDFNNLLMAIQGNISLLGMDMDKDSPHSRRIRNIEQCVESGSELTRQLLGFARGGKYEVKPVDINQLIQKTSDMFEQTRKEIRVSRNLQKDVWSVEVDRGQVEQVLLNLYVNAWQAMPAGGELFIDSSNVTLDKNSVESYGAKPGRYVEVSVMDTGVGMDEKTMARIFEPFFTTKEMSRGSGLGLASAYGIIRNHGGFITVSSRMNKGSTFQIYLPASSKSAEGDEDHTSGSVLYGNEKVLLIDDEDMIIEIGTELLEQLGYEVLTARSGKEAIEIFRSQKDTINLVILDMIMPGISGSEIYDQLRKVRNGIRVILSSGYSLNGHAQSILNRGCNGFIQKPFDLRTLSQKIRDVLDVKPAG